MDQQQILEELESAIEAMEQALTALAGAIAEQGDAKKTLLYLHTAEAALGAEYGPNGWRDRFFRKMQVRTALTARRRVPDDASLQTLAASILQETPDQADWN